MWRRHSRQEYVSRQDAPDGPEPAAAGASYILSIVFILSFPISPYLLSDPSCSSVLVRRVAPENAGPSASLQPAPLPCNRLSPLDSLTHISVIVSHSHHPSSQPVPRSCTRTPARVRHLSGRHVTDRRLPAGGERGSRRARLIGSSRGERTLVRLVGARLYRTAAIGVAPMR